MDLNGAVQNLLQDSSDKKLDQRDIRAYRCRSLHIDRAGRLQDKQPRRIDLSATLRDPLLHVLTTPEHHARRQLSACRITAHQIKRPLADADPTHTVMNP